MEAVNGQRAKRNLAQTTKLPKGQTRKGDWLGGFILGSILTIIGGILLRKELKKVASFLKLFFIRASSFGPALVILGFIFIIIGIPFLVFLPGLLAWGILLLIIGIPLATTNLILKHHVVDEWGYNRRCSRKS